MFSVSLPTCSGIDARAVLEAALAQVAEESFFAMIDPPADDWRDEWGGHREWLDGTVAFHGAGKGVLTVRLPLALARDLTSAFLGLSTEELDGDVPAVADMIGEVANMICGCWLTRAFQKRLFHLEKPVVERGSDAPSDEWLVVMLNGMPMGIAVSVYGV
jgi:hypothetical protein